MGVILSISRQLSSGNVQTFHVSRKGGNVSSPRISWPFLASVTVCGEPVLDAVQGCHRASVNQEMALVGEAEIEMLARDIGDPGSNTHQPKLSADLESFKLDPEFGASFGGRRCKFESFHIEYSTYFRTEVNGFVAILFENLLGIPVAGNEE